MTTFVVGIICLIVGYVAGYLRYGYAARAELHKAFPELATPESQAKHKKAVFQYYRSLLPGWLSARLETREEAESDCAACYVKNHRRIPACSCCPQHKRRRTTFGKTEEGLEVCCPGIADGLGVLRDKVSILKNEELKKSGLINNG